MELIGPEPHRNGRKLPEILHQPRVGIRRKPRTFAQFVAEVVQLLFGQSAFEKGAGVDAGRCVALEIDKVAGLIAVTAAEEMVEPDLEQGRQRRIGRDVAADAVVVLILVRHHRHGVPARQALDAALQRTVAGIGHFLIHSDRVDVICCRADRNGQPRCRGRVPSTCRGGN